MSVAPAKPVAPDECASLLEEVGVDDTGIDRNIDGAGPILDSPLPLAEAAAAALAAAGVAAEEGVGVVG